MLMKPFLIVLLMLMVALTACHRTDVIDDTYPWPASGVADADSLLLAFEHARNSLSTPDSVRNDIIRRFELVARDNPDNRVLQVRRFYLTACSLLNSDPRRAYEMLNDRIAQFDSIALPYDLHALSALRLPYEKSIFTKYMIASENAEYFAEVGAEVELARNLMLKGNALTELGDTTGAMECYDRAEALFERHGNGGVYAVRLNRLPLLAPEVAQRQLDSLLNESAVSASPKLYVSLLQTAYYLTDSLPLLERAINLASEHPTQRPLLPILLAMKTGATADAGHTAEALFLADSVLASEALYNPATRYRPVIHHDLAMVYEAAGRYPDCIDQLKQVTLWTDSLHRESNHRAIYANEARMLIDVQQRNSALHRRNLVLWWALSLTVVIAVAIITVLNLRRNAAKHRQQLRLLDETIANERRMNVTMSSVLEQSERLVADLNDLTTHSPASLFTAEGHATVTRLIAAYRSNEPNRQGLLKVNREVDSSFSRHLKKDYPELSESQLRLASLIAAGVDGQQLAAILNISPKSLYTGRYRLRSRLGLPKEASLEDFLRTYAGTAPK